MTGAGLPPTAVGQCVSVGGRKRKALAGKACGEFQLVHEMVSENGSPELSPIGEAFCSLPAIYVLDLPPARRRVKELVMRRDYRHHRRKYSRCGPRAERRERCGAFPGGRGRTGRHLPRIEGVVPEIV
jgi:hypothetical protein